MNSIGKLKARYKRGIKTILATVFRLRPFRDSHRFFMFRRATANEVIECRIVRFWHLADIELTAPNVRFWG